jgi:hypothetical protein
MPDMSAGRLNAASKVEIALRRGMSAACIARIALTDRVAARILTP